MLPRFGIFIGSFFLAPKHHHDAAFGIELDDHVRTLVDGPDVVIFINANHVRERPRVKVLADFPNVFSVLVELEQLGGSGGICRSRRASAMEHEDVSLGICCDSGNLTEIQVRRQLQEVHVRVERNLRNRLRIKSRSDEQKKNQYQTLHDNPPH